MKERSNLMPVGVPSNDERERFAAWELESLSKKKKLFLPGGVIGTKLGDIPNIIPAAVVQKNAKESISLHFHQTNQKAHLGLFAEIEKFRTTGPFVQFGMMVENTEAFGETLSRKPKGTKGTVGKGEIRFWIGVEGRKQPHKSSAIQVSIHSKPVEGAVKLGKMDSGKLLGPALYCPERWCLNTLCQSHWTWWPGVPATTSCHGLCIFAGPCNCMIWGVNPPARGPICSGLQVCFC